jgi:hypothetical protein
MSRSLVDHIIAGLGILALGFGVGCWVAGGYIYAKTLAYAAPVTPPWVATVRAFTWAGFLAFGLAALTLIVRDYRRRTATDPSTKTR